MPKSSRSGRSPTSVKSVKSRETEHDTINALKVWTDFFQEQNISELRESAGRRNISTNPVGIRERLIKYECNPEKRSSLIEEAERESQGLPPVKKNLGRSTTPKPYSGKNSAEEKVEIGLNDPKSNSFQGILATTSTPSTPSPSSASSMPPLLKLFIFIVAILAILIPVHIIPEYYPECNYYIDYVETHIRTLIDQLNGGFAQFSETPISPVIRTEPAATVTAPGA